MSKKKILCIFSNHTSNMIKYNISLSNISILKKFVTNIIIVDSIEEEYGNKLCKDFEDDPILLKYFLIKNDNYYDFGKWTYVLKLLTESKNSKNESNNSYSIDNYDYILFVNDSIVINNNIENYFIYLNNNVSQNINLYAYNDSTQIKYHYQSYFFSIKTCITNKFISFFESKKSKIHDLESLVHNVEINLCEIDPSHDCLIKIGNEYNMTKNIYWENEVLYKFLLSKQIFALLKLKRIYDIHKEYKLTIYGYNIEDFDYNFYKTYYDDINVQNMSNPELLNHFVTIGQFEGRKFNKKFNVLLPDYYKNFLQDIKLLYFFDIPDDFDVYYYKRHYSDVKHLSTMDTIFHYLNYGIYQSRRYNKINDLNTYMNNFYINILKLNNKITEPYTFNINFSLYMYYLLNSFKNTKDTKDTNNTKDTKDTKDTNNEKSNLMLIHSLINNTSNEYDDYSVDKLHKLLSAIDYDIYKKLHPNTISYSYIDIIKNYLYSNNSNQIYKIPDDFNYVVYSKIYNDISTLNPNDLKFHYIEYGHKENRIYKLPNDFDPLLYKSLYDDLSNMNNEELKEHYLYVGIKSNRIYKILNDFDSITYQKIYDDLGGLDKIQLYEHYMNCGIKEKRIYKIPFDFNPFIYKKIYPELELINDAVELCNHYLFNGLRKDYIYKIPDDFNLILYKKIYKNIISEINSLNDNDLNDYYLFNGVRNSHIYKLPDDFNSLLYKSIYKELENMNEQELIEHYLYIGIHKGYIYKLPLDFNVEKYIKIYDDLKSLDKETCKLHYLYYGMHENRIYKVPDNFNVNIYKKIYSLLNNLTDEEVKDHYLFNIKNGHIYNIPHDFNCEMYKNIYDLNNLTNEELKEHYLYYGLKKAYIYKLPCDFDPYTYYRIYENEFKTKFKNEFVDENNKIYDDKLIQHYLYKGIKENRIYKIPDDFIPSFYKYIYYDLEKLSDIDAINHYLFYGISEERIYKIPDDFDLNFYKELYEDLRHLNDNELKIHYLKYGIHEGRIYK